MSFLDFDPVVALGVDPADVSPTPDFDIGAIATAGSDPGLHFKPPAGLFSTAASAAREGSLGTAAQGALTLLSFIPSPVQPIFAIGSALSRVTAAARAISERGPGRADAPSRLNIPPAVAPTPEVDVALFDGLGGFLTGATTAVQQVGGLVSAVGNLFGRGNVVSTGPANASSAAMVQPAVFRLPVPRGGGGLPVPRGVPRLPGQPGLPIPGPPLGPPTGAPPPGDLWPNLRRDGVSEMGEVVCRPASRRQMINEWLRQVGYTWKTTYRLIRLVGPEVAAGATGLDLGSISFVLAHPPRRRGRGISAADLRRTRSTIAKVKTINRMLGTTARRSRK